MRVPRRLPAVVVLLALNVIFFLPYVVPNGGFFFPYDNLAYHYPALALVSDALRRGVAPLWDIYTYSGFPLVADPQVGMFYPPHLLLYIIGGLLGHLPYRAVEWILIGHMAALGIFTYLMLRDQGLGRVASITGAILAEFGGYSLSQSQHLGIVEATTWIPLAILAVRRTVTARSLAWPALLGATVAVDLLTGAVIVTVPLVLLVGVYALYLTAVMAVTDSASTVPSTAARLAAAGTFALGLGAVGLLPEIQLTQLSVAAHAGAGPVFAMDTLWTLFMPNLFGHLGGHFTYPGDPTITYFYTSPLLVIGVLLAPLGLRHRRTLVFWPIFLLVVAVLMEANHGALIDMARRLPIVGQTLQFWLVSIVMVAAVTTAAIGLDWAVGRVMASSMRHTLAGTTLMIAAVAVCTLLIGLESGRLKPAEITPVSPDLRLLAASAIAIWIVVLTGPALLAPRWRSSWLLAIPLLAFCDLYAMNSLRSFDSSAGDPEEMYTHAHQPIDLAAVRYLQKHAGPANRVMVDENLLGPPWTNGSRVFHWQSANGLYPLDLRDYMGLIRLGADPVGGSDALGPGDYQSSVFDLAGVNLWLTRATINEPAYKLPDQEPGYRLIYDQFFKVYSREHALPRVRIPGRVLLAPSHEGALDQIRKARPGNIVEVVEAPAACGGVGEPAVTGGKATITAYDLDNVSIDATAAEGGWLVLADTYYPGWRAWVDGTEVPVRRADYAFRAVCLTPGHHTVTFAFESVPLLIGAAITISTGLFALGVLIVRKAAARSGEGE